jgi:hypothetical protein
MQDEFYAIIFHNKHYSDLAQLQIDLDAWLVHYNQERPHCGRYCYGKPPMQTFVESIRLAKKKLPDQVTPAAYYNQNPFD